MQYVYDAASSVARRYQAPQLDRVDPIHIIATAALIRYKEAMSRLRFDGVKLVIQEPHATTSAMRTLNLTNGSREILWIIDDSIQLVAKWYTEQNQHQKEVHKLFQRCIEGYDRLNETYHSESKNTVKLINDFIDNANKILKNEKLPTKELATSPEAIKNLWSIEDLHILNVHFQKLSKNPEDSDAIESIQLLLKQHSNRLKVILFGDNPPPTSDEFG